MNDLDVTSERLDIRTHEFVFFVFQIKWMLLTCELCTKRLTTCQQPPSVAVFLSHETMPRSFSLVTLQMKKEYLHQKLITTISTEYNPTQYTCTLDAHSQIVPSIHVQSDFQSVS
jgi:hypothetical protein